MTSRLTFTLGTSLAALLIASAAGAQTSGGSGTGAPAGTPAGGGEPEAVSAGVAGASGAPAADTFSEGDIVVTANKREQNLSKVGLSITAVGAEQLATQRIVTVADLAQVTPGMTFAPTPNATPVYTIRGVGFYESSLNAYPDVSLYLDQVPLSLPIMSAMTAFDLERVEVLKGPQGTLFGNNATGGAINFVAAKPTKEFKAGAELSYGRFNTFDVAAFISGPITDTLSARLAVKAVNGDEWQRSYTRDDKLGKQDNIAGRFLLDWKPTDRLSFELNLNAWRDQNDPQAPQRIGYTPQNDVSGIPAGGTAPVPFPQATYPNAPSNARAADWTPGDRPYSNNRFKQASLRADYDLDFATITSISGYSDMKFENATEGGGTALRDLDLPLDEGHIKSFTQELRIAGDVSKPLRWVVGANYERTTVNELTFLRFTDTSSTYVNGFTGAAYETDSKMRNYAAFANIEYDVTEQIKLKGGIRQTKAKRDFTAFNGDNRRFDISDQITFGGQQSLTYAQFFNLTYPAIYGAGNVPVIPQFGSIIIDNRVNADGTPVDSSTYLKPGLFNGKLNEDSTSWSVGIDYEPVPEALLYVNVSKGYKAGSFPHLSGAIYDAYEAVTQESILDYEAGFKLQLMDRKLSINGAAFYYDYRDKQLRAKFVDPIFGALDRLVNVPKSKIKGAEIEITARPVRGLVLTGAATYLDAKVSKYDGVVGAAVDPATGLRVAVTESFKGVRLPFSPKLQYTLRADYGFPLSDDLKGFVGAGVNGQTKSAGVLTTFGVDPDLFRINARALVNANLGFGAADESWRVSVWGKNIFNKYYWTNAVQAYDTVVRYSGRPSEYGVTLGLQF
ncbi:TonB-dependent receptor [Sphingomonas sp. ID0503]|uniref:TonB-dependent receptor n=1 Tax=Sphingomonas sp. ID0503 TaxID=3399691 RepID=UPI003AFA1129